MSENERGRRKIQGSDVGKGPECGNKKTLQYCRANSGIYMIMVNTLSL